MLQAVKSMLQAVIVTHLHLQMQLQLQRMACQWHASGLDIR